MAKHVLVADDDEHIRFQIVSLLKQRGYTVETAIDGKDAIARAIENPPDLLITDVMMPKLDGWSLVRELRAHPKHAHLPVIFLTALSSEDDKLQAFRLGADDYVMKPFRLDDLAKRVAKALSGSRTPAQGVATAASGLRGDLAQVGLSTLLVLVEMERKTGILEVRDPTGHAAAITLRDGKVLQAQMRGTAKIVDADCIYQLLRWKAGAFEFEARDRMDAVDRIQTSTTALLMEGARRADEESAPVRMPPSDAPPARPSQKLAQAKLDDDALAEWGEDERTPLVVAAKLAELVRKTARATLPPLNVPAIEPAPVVAALPDVEPAPAVEPAPVAAEPPRIAVEAEPRRIAEPPAPRARKRGPSLAWLAFAVVAGAAGAVLPMLLPQASATAAAADSARLRDDADALSAAIDTATTAATSRARTLATTPLLRAGIETDSETIQDLAKNESLFVPVNGEVIEVFQLHDGAATSMLRLPAGAPAVRPMIDEKTRLDTDGKAITIVASALVAKQTSGTGGVLAIATPCNLATVTRTLAEHATSATLVGLAQPVALVGTAPSAATVTLPLAKQPGLSLAATVAAPAASNELPELRYALWGVAGVFLLAYGVLVVRRSQSS